MLGQLQSGIRKWYVKPSDLDGLVIPFPEIWAEMQAFVKIKGKPQATIGAHDDMVMALAIGHSVAHDMVPKRSTRPVDPEKKKIRHLKAIGLKSAAEFYEKLRSINGKKNR